MYTPEKLARLEAAFARYHSADGIIPDTDNNALLLEMIRYVKDMRALLDVLPYFSLASRAANNELYQLCNIAHSRRIDYKLWS